MFNPCPASACFLLPPKSHQRTPCFLPFCGCQSSTRALPQISFPWKTQCPRYPGLAEKMLRCEPSGSLVTGMTPAPITQLGHGMAKVHPMRSVRKAVIYINSFSLSHLHEAHGSRMDKKQLVDLSPHIFVQSGPWYVLTSPF